MFLTKNIIKPNATIHVKSMNLLMQPFKDIVPLFLLMDKQVLEKPIQWQANRKFLVETFINPIKEKELFPEQFNNYGKKSNNINKNIK
jgi:hypothetical protein